MSKSGRTLNDSIRAHTPRSVQSPLTYGDLLSLPPGTGGHAFLYCRTCGGRWSANRADYFMCADDRPVTCGNGHAASRMIIAREECRIIQVKP